jgi:3-hydroxyisobutyrate dehydrogenase-like beta-hydroxyacid dehydrogenase
MNNYIARVELHHATSIQDYDKLHSSMYKKGFLRLIVGDDQKTYQLPTGTYVLRASTISLEDARNNAAAAAAETGKSSEIIVSDWVQAGWVGLPTV